MPVRWCTTAGVDVSAGGGQGRREGEEGAGGRGGGGGGGGQDRRRQEEERVPRPAVLRQHRHAGTTVRLSLTWSVWSVPSVWSGLVWCVWRVGDGCGGGDDVKRLEMNEDTGAV